MRLFIAVNFSENALKSLLAARERLRELTGGRGGFTQDTNLHLTLAFLGEVAEARVPSAAEAMAAAGGRPLTLVIDRSGRFRRDGGDIWWAGAADIPHWPRTSAGSRANCGNGALIWKTAAFRRTSRWPGA